MLSAEELIAMLKLQPHPKEGGYFRETYRSSESLGSAHAPQRYGGDRSFCTAIYYLLTPTSISAMHRLATDEIFHFYLGDPVRMLQLGPGKESREIVLGTDMKAGQQLQVVVPRGVWQGSALEPGGKFALLGCTVAPGFDYADYEHGKRAELIDEFPRHEQMIRQLTLD
ncbi:MAG TPA: cupin domain-containing protein [Gemmataceae bacterium]|nr:cupin domain-containing protein [Gemmataceae bacterium]